jgi:hypothetical protein
MMLRMDLGSRATTRSVTFLVAGLLSGALLLSNSVGARAHGAPATDPSACPYLIMSAVNFRPPIQADEHAGYPMTFLSMAKTAGTALVIKGQFPYAAWMQWYTYNALREGALPIDALQRGEITPDVGSTNPYIVGNPMLAQKRDYTLLVVPEGTDRSTLPANLQTIPASNVMTRTTSGPAWNTTERIYAELPNYDRTGSFGPTNTPLPVQTLVSLQTGEPISCADANLVPAKVIHDPSKPAGKSESELGFGLGDGGFGLPAGPKAPRGLYPPKPHRALVEFFRPGLLDAPAPDVPSIPPPDSCSGYLNARLNVNQIALIRVPKVPSYTPVTGLGPSTPYPDTDVSYVSYNIYSSSLGSYVPGSPNSMGLGNSDILTDATGGATILVWPRAMPRRERQRVFAVARTAQWNLLRGGTQGRVYANTMYVRFKGTSATYKGGFTPNANRPGVPCYQNPVNEGGLPSGTAYRNVPARYAATPKEIGAATPQGVQCSARSLLSGTCLTRLRVHIRRTGGNYTVRNR